MCRQLGYTRAAAAKALQVSERTLHNWVSGKTAVPYAAYKLLRVLCFHEIPFKTWQGWHFTGGKLWSPEGHGFMRVNLGCPRATVDESIARLSHAVAEFRSDRERAA